MISRLILLIILPSLVLSQNILDEQGKRQGNWNQKHSNGQLRYEGQFKNNIPIGIFKHYDKNGNLTANLKYFNQGNSVAARLFYHKRENTCYWFIFE